ncbi:MAG: MFS transporter [Anaerolineae bacterium]|nr:MFS transporter [Anaerolineae bacterium]
MQAPRRQQPSAVPRVQLQPGTVLRLLYFLFYGSMACWVPFFGVYLQQVGLSGGQIGLIASLRQAAVLVSQPIWGAVADVRGRRELLLSTMLLAVLILPGYIWPGGFSFLLIWTLLFGLLTNPVGALIDSLVLDHLQERPDTAFGKVRVFGAIGWATASLLAGRALSGRDLRLGFALAASFMLAGWLVARWNTLPTRRATALGGTWHGASTVLADRRLLTLLALIVVAQLGMVSIITFYPVYLAGLGAPAQLLGLAFTLQGFSEMPLYLGAAGIIRRLSATRAVALSFFVAAARVFLYSVIHVPGLAVAVEAVHGLCYALFLVAAVDYVNSIVPAQWRATGQTLLGAAYFGAGGILGNAFAGHLYDRLGVQGMFRVNAAVVLAAAILALLLLRPPVRTPSVEAGSES